MERTIITESAYNLRFLGRRALAGNWLEATMVVVIFILCVQVPVIFIDSFFGKNIVLDYSVAGYEWGVNVGRTSPVSGIFTLLVTGAFVLGISRFFLALIRRKKHSTGQVFSGFEHFGKAFLLMFLYSLFIFLWSLLLIVPGIIAAFRYSQAFYILADSPEKGVMECISLSKEMMRDNKFKLFCVDLSFIGWLLLAAVPSGVVSGVLAATSAGESVFFAGDSMGYFLFSIIILAASIPTYIVVAYMTATQTVFYEMLNGRDFVVQ